MIISLSLSGPREQLNQNTAFVDASHIYGQDICQADSLRDFSGGKMQWTPSPIHGGKIMMPTTETNKECKSELGKCYVAGDHRASEQPALAAIHTIFLREHNRIVDELARVSHLFLPEL